MWERARGHGGNGSNGNTQQRQSCSRSCIAGEKRKVITVHGDRVTASCSLLKPQGVTTAGGLHAWRRQVSSTATAPG